MFDLFEDYPNADPVFVAATQVLGRDPRALVKSLSLEALHSNRLGQVLCVTHALAAYRCLRDAVDAPILVAGYSVGEMPAWSIAGVWSPQQALALTSQRAMCMDAASGLDGTLGYVRGLAHDTVATLCDEVECYIAIVNPSKLMIIGGERQKVTKACTRARQAGASHADTIAVHIASHTPILQSAVRPFEAHLNAAPLQPLTESVRLVTASTARAVQDLQVARSGLGRQLAETIHWDRTLEALAEYGATHVLELGPGRGLADMVRKAYPLIPARTLDDFATLEGARQWIKS